MSLLETFKKKVNITLEKGVISNRQNKSSSGTR